MDRTGNADDITEEESRCFVCDAKIQGRYYALATCRTRNSRTRLIEKLGELVGERYMVVISEDDMICRSCALLINTLDRLDMEMRDIRDQVLEFLEQKYSLKNRELRDDDNRPKPCQPPQITKSSTKENIDYCSKKQNETDLDTEEERNSIYSKDHNVQKNSHSWLQCSNCKYITRIGSFMIHHLRNHYKTITVNEIYGLNTIQNQWETRHNYIRTNKSENKEDNSDATVKNDLMKTLLLEKTL